MCMCVCVLYPSKTLMQRHVRRRITKKLSMGGPIVLYHGCIKTGDGKIDTTVGVDELGCSIHILIANLWIYGFMDWTTVHILNAQIWIAYVDTLGPTAKRCA